VRIIEDSPIGAFLVVHLIYDVRDAMGANAVNTAANDLRRASKTSPAGACTCGSCPTLQIDV
jgi:hydroxymethylglutaryl-CoA reductase